MTQDREHDLSKLYRAGSHEEPPQWIDRHIAQAARGVTRRSAWRGVLNALSGWQVSFSSVAVLVLCVSLVMVLREEPSQTASHGSRQAEVSTTSPPTSPVTPLSQAPSTSEKAGLAAAPERQDPSIAPMPPPLERFRVQQHRSAPAHPQKPPRGSDDVAAQTNRRGAASAIQSVRPADTQEDDEALPRAMASAPGRDMPGPPPKPQSAELESATRAEQSNQTRKASVSGRHETSHATEAMRSTPTAWLEHLFRLLRANREQELTHELKQFRQRYPDHPVPLDLQRYLPRVLPKPADEPSATSPSHDEERAGQTD